MSAACWARRRSKPPRYAARIEPVGDPGYNLLMYGGTCYWQVLTPLTRRELADIARIEKLMAIMDRRWARFVRRYPECA